MTVYLSYPFLSTYAPASGDSGFQDKRKCSEFLAYFHKCKH